MSRIKFLGGAVLLMFLGAIAGCDADQQAAGPVAPGADSISADAIRITRCEPQPYAIAIALIGPKGGDIKAGRHEFKVPEGALSGPTLITMESLADTIHSVRFSPAGLTFNAGHLPELKMDYGGCENPPKGRSWRIVYITDVLDILEVLPKILNPLGGGAGAQLSHFSRYAVAW